MIVPMGLSILVSGRSASGLVMIGGSSAMSVMWGIINARYRKKNAAMMEAKRRDVYGKYIADTENLLREKYDKEYSRLLLNNPDVSQCATWEDCTLRVWLNNNFYSTAFSSAEKQRIVESAITAEANPTNSFAVAGNNTKDRVFILSASEVNQYLTGNYERAAYGTDYAFGNGLYNNGMLGSTWWWVRTPGKTNKWAVRVLSTGEMAYDGTYVNSDNGGVRPAIWITVD